MCKAVSNGSNQYRKYSMTLGKADEFVLYGEGLECSYLKRNKRKRVAEGDRGHEEMMILIGFLLLSASHLYLP